MADTLSQKEVDSLLHGHTRGATPALAEVVPYNFVRPSRVSKERQATLEAVFTRFAVALQALLTSRLRTPMDVTITGVEQMTFNEYVLSLPSPCSTFVFRANDRTGSLGGLDLGSELGFLIVERLFGGFGDGAVQRRAHTALEQAIVRGVADRALALLRDAWAGHVEMSPENSHFESNPAMLQFTGREDNVLVTTLMARSDAAGATLTVCLPMAVFEAFLQELNAAGTAGNPAEPGSHRAALAAPLQQARVTVHARLPLFTLSTRAVAGLEPGQTLHTGHPVDAPIEVHVNGRLHHLGVLGQLRRYIGVRLVQPVTNAPADRPVPAREGRVQ